MKTVLFVFNGDMSGHPSMRSYMDAGWQIITF